MRKKISKTRCREIRKRIRVILIVSVLTLMAVGTFCSVVPGTKILYVQVKMFSWHNKIENAESARDYNNEQAVVASSPQLAKYYVKMAESYDCEVKRLTANRKSFIANAKDSTIVWASKDMFNFGVLVVGLLLIGLPITIWFLFVHFLEQVANVLLFIERCIWNAYIRH